MAVPPLPPHVDPELSDTDNHSSCTAVDEAPVDLPSVPFHCRLQQAPAAATTQGSQEHDHDPYHRGPCVVAEAASDSCVVAEQAIKKRCRIATLSCCKRRKKTRALTEENKREQHIMGRLCKQLLALKSLLPPEVRSSADASSVITDALRYKKALRQEIQVLKGALPTMHAEKVCVSRKNSGCLHIQVACGKKTGLLIALMEVMETFGLVFSRVSVSCQDRISIDAVTTQGSSQETRAKDLERALKCIINNH